MYTHAYVCIDRRCAYQTRPRQQLEIRQIQYDWLFVGHRVELNLIHARVILHVQQHTFQNLNETTMFVLSPFQVFVFVSS